jgi:hypothetical protein
MRKRLFSIHLSYFLFGLQVCALLACAQPVQARLYFVGSNPIFSIIAYPQDLGLPYYNRRLAAYTVSYQNLPWWGNVGNPLLKPNDTYTSTEQDLTFDQESWFEQNGYRQIFDQKLEYWQPWTSDLRSLFSFHYTSQTLQNTAAGNLEYTDPVTGYVPFSYSMLDTFSSYGLQAITSAVLFGYPVGAKLNYDADNTASVTSRLTATVDGRDITSGRFLWGWSTSPCNHIFDKHGINGDAWFLDSYALGPTTKFDAQIGLTLPNVKLGDHLRYTTSTLDQYSWTPVDSPANTIEANFLGQYTRSNWLLASSLLTERLYANVTWHRQKEYALNTYFFLALDAMNVKNVLRSDRAVDSGSLGSVLSGAIEANPNINIYLTKDIIIDAAILAEACFTRYENTYSRWNATLGGSQKRFYDTGVYVGNEYAWENYSYADESFFDFGFETDIILPVFKTADSELTLFPDLMINSKFTYLTKSFGQNDDGGFAVQNRRQNFKREIWFNSSLSVLYRINRVNFRLDIIQPLLYALMSETKVLDGADVLFDSKKVNQWAVQDGLQVKLWAGIEF